MLLFIVPRREMVGTGRGEREPGLDAEWTCFGGNV
jgi:hypothetical protein